MGYEFDEFFMSESDKTRLFGAISALQTNPYKQFDKALLECWHLIPFLPKKLISKLVELRSNPKKACLLIDNLPLDESQPKANLDWYAKELDKTTYISETLILLISNIIGDIYSHQEESGGRFIRNLVTQGNEGNTSSSVVNGNIMWHTDFAWSNVIPDFILLFCSIGDPNVTTKISSIDFLMKKLTLEERKILSKPVFRFGIPDTLEYIYPNSFLSPLRPVINEKLNNTLLHFNNYSTQCPNDAKGCLCNLNYLMDSNNTSYTLSEGQLLIINNRIAAHSKKLTIERPSKNFRWLQQAYVKNDFFTVQKHIVGKNQLRLNDYSIT